MTNKITVGVQGMHCASCAKIIEKEIKKNPNVSSITINPLTEEAEIIADHLDQQMVNKQLKKLGYSFNFPTDGPKDQKSPTIKDQKTVELKNQKRKLQIALPLMSLILFLMFWSLAAQYFNFQPVHLIGEMWAMLFTFTIASIFLFWIGRNFLWSAIHFFRYGKANMDTLIGLGTGVAYLYSAFIYIFPVWRQAWGLAEMYFFDVAIVVITLVYLGKYLESKAKLKTNEVIEKLINLQTKTALVERSGREEEISINDLQVNDIVIVKPGMKIPADGIVVQGESAIDEALITGESLPVDKKVGDEVIGSTINKQGVLKIKINHVGSETVLATIIKAVAEAQNSKAPIQKLADQVAAVFVPIVLVLATATLIIWLTVGSNYLARADAISLGITAFVSILAIACPCALGLATPTGIMVSLDLASENGLLIKNAASLERFGKTKIMVMDKTGTLTMGQPQVSEIISGHLTRRDFLTIVASLEKNSEHPLAQAITQLAQQEKTELLSVTNFSAQVGQGIRGKINNQEYWLGNAKMMASQKLTLPQEKLDQLEKQGKTVMFLSNGQKILGLISVADKIKPEAPELIAQLHQLGIKIIMLSGDRQGPAQHIAAQTGINEVMAEVSPLEKALKIKEIKKRGQIVTMVGDGVNDAVALVESDVGIAMASGADVAIESADITVLHGDLSKIIKALKISRLTMKKIKQNLFWAFFYNIIAIPIAAGVLYPAFKIMLSPIIAAAAMSLSSVSVILNTLLIKKAKL